MYSTPTYLSLNCTKIMAAQEVRQIFEQFDTDNSGTIDAKELYAALNQLGLKLDRTETMKVLKQYSSSSHSLDMPEVPTAPAFYTTSGPTPPSHASSTITACAPAEAY